MSPVLGIDMGGVIVTRKLGRRDVTLTSDKKDYIFIPPISETLESVGELVKRFKGKVFVVSRIDKMEHEERAHRWFRHWNFFNVTGLNPVNLRFCLKRYEKAPICRDLSITHFIDDRVEVLSHMVGVVNNLFAFDPREEELDQFSSFLPKVNVVRSWKEILSHKSFNL
jgi:hypothetical protein